MILSARTRKKYPYLEKYDIHNNMAYGTEKHLLAITEYGLTKFHRKTFGTCKKYSHNKNYILQE